MEKTIGYIFLLIALVWTLPLFGIEFLQKGNLDHWIVILAFIIIGILKIISKDY